ncbi:hypothetical protein IFM89_027682 [Coptis chinensis]|uniref:Uncharacterized protein n=1 Tax=Coptis chinensis TaxID=261450 RepID=A0A835IY28_9MAGN|nr:hypothetical protein IFM89_027682 [Coptis chinensis]
MYSQENNVTIIHDLFSTMFDLKQAESTSINEYFSKFKGLWDEWLVYHPYTTDLKIQKEQRDQMQTMMFLHSLNSEYTTFKDQILAGETIPMASQALSRLMRKKQENVVTLPHPMESSVLISSGFRGGRGNGSGSVRGDRGGGRGSKRGGGRGGRGNLGHLKCTFCGRTNHLEDRCWKKYGKPEWANQVFEESSTSNVFVPLAGAVSPASSFAGMRDEILHQIIHQLSNLPPSNHVPTTATLANSGNTTFMDTSPSSWVIDSGASSHSW